MTSFAVIFALIITVPLGIFITRNKVLSGAATGIANVMQSHLSPVWPCWHWASPFLGVGKTLSSLWSLSTPSYPF